MKSRGTPTALRIWLVTILCTVGATIVDPVVASRLDRQRRTGSDSLGTLASEPAVPAAPGAKSEQQIMAIEIPENPDGLSYNRTVYGTWTTIDTAVVTPASNEVIWATAKTTTRITSGRGILSAARILCGKGTSVKTTTNIYADGTETPQLIKLVYHPLAAEIGTLVTCRLQAMATAGYSMTVVGDAAGTKTWLQARRELGGWAWGTVLDANNAVDNHGEPVTIVGAGLQSATRSSITSQTCSVDLDCNANLEGNPCATDSLQCDCVSRKCQRFAYSAETSDAGSSEYVLRGRRFTAHSFATALDVYSDPELTCQTNNADTRCGVTVTLVVERMKSATSSALCQTTTTTQSRTITGAEHHKKLYLSALNVPINVRCSDGTMPAGRTFLVRTLVAITTGNDDQDYIVVEPGYHDDPNLRYTSGYSITNVIQRFPVGTSTLR
jgi:hypothetical protein